MPKKGVYLFGNQSHKYMNNFIENYDLILNHLQKLEINFSQIQQKEEAKVRKPRINFYEFNS